MNCPKCNTPNPVGQKFCGNCGATLPQEPKKPKKPVESFNDKTWFVVLMCIFVPPVGIIFSWRNKKPKNKIARIMLTIFLVFYSFSWFGAIFDGCTADDSDTKTTQTQDNSSKKSNDTAKSSDSNANDSNSSDGKGKDETPAISPEEYKAQCQELNYNDVMRNPDQYKGQKFKITVKIMSASHKISGATYYKAYTDDGSGYYMDKMVWIFDKRDEKEDGYTKILEDDIVTFYGEFDGLQETKNALNDEKGEDFALNAYYVDMVQEAQ